MQAALASGTKSRWSARAALLCSTTPETGAPEMVVTGIPGAAGGHCCAHRDVLDEVDGVLVGEHVPQPVARQDQHLVVRAQRFLPHVRGGHLRD